MKNKTFLNYEINEAPAFLPKAASKYDKQLLVEEDVLPEILFITSYPPRECGIATYSQDLVQALSNKFEHSFLLKVCALECGNPARTYPEEVRYVLDTNNSAKYVQLVHNINNDKRIQLVFLQHEFGLFHNAEVDLLQFLYSVVKPIIIAFHTVLPNPNDELKAKVRHIVGACASIIVLTKKSAQILRDEYGISADKISVIPHGTHLVPHLDKALLKEKYELEGKKILSTFGLLSSGKSIETTLDALPAIVNTHPDVVFLVIGKTHGGVIKSEGEQYRHSLEAKVKALGLENHVKFINRYLPLQDLLEYLQLTDIYLFTSKDPNQAVSGTFSYAMSCGCPIISTPIPHVREVLSEDTGILIDFQNVEQLANAVNRLMSDEKLRIRLSANSLRHIVPTAWENSAISHALLLQKVAEQAVESDTVTKATPSVLKPHADGKIVLHYRLPDINLQHIKKMTTDFGMYQFAKINQPDIESGYTLDDNARAMIAMCMHYKHTKDKGDIPYIRIYLNFIKYCLQSDGNFLNYVDIEKRFTEQNNETNLSDSNGRAIWALGYLISQRAFLPKDLNATAESLMSQALPQVIERHSPRTMAFVIKGLYYSNIEKKSSLISNHIKTLADRLVQMYRHESEPKWLWYESYMTYGNSILPEALLFASMDTGINMYKEIAKESFDFLLSVTFNENRIKVISNRSWLQKGQEAAEHGEQPIDVAYTILALREFYKVFKDERYKLKMSQAFDWFLGNNHLKQIIYNPCTGGCCDGLEEKSVNLNQGAESTLSYLVSRLTMEEK